MTSHPDRRKGESSQTQGKIAKGHEDDKLGLSILLLWPQVFKRNRKGKRRLAQRAVNDKRNWLTIDKTLCRLRVRRSQHGFTAIRGAAAASIMANAAPERWSFSGSNAISSVSQRDDPVSISQNMAVISSSWLGAASSWRIAQIRKIIRAEKVHKVGAFPF